MKPLAGGQIKSASAAVKFVLRSDAVSTVIPGVHTEKELEEDIIAVLKSPAFTKQDEDSLLPDIEKLKGYVCRQCGYCVSVDGGCPKGINIMGFMRLDAYHNALGPAGWVLDEYGKQEAKPEACILCGHCERVCPYGLPIMRILRDMKVRDAYEKLPRRG
jgi:predicted aldo/keto reductase-like oxidoreductase